ncbi:hypothetical protein [Paenibacillus graminis]|uniref:hypothetical protein n=1 Tax=Paenibacillus graminis TaxID=189425 RepID=UPI002DBA275C|nr:hypothetical protein [Paenibacillus graminis]MEC0167494.1 hypothetical protein [Paenibacillus graminis]
MKTKPVVTDAKVVCPISWSNMAIVDFTLEGEAEMFGMRFYTYDGQEVSALVYFHPYLNKYIDSDNDTGELMPQIMKILESKGESLFEAGGHWGKPLN